MAKNQIAKKDYSTSPTAVGFNFSDKQTVTVSFSDFPEEIQARLLQYGIAQKLGDEYARAEGPEEARSAMEGLIERLKAGEWKQTREGGGGARTTMLAEALASVTGQPVDECQAKIAEMEDGSVKELKAHVQVAAALARIKLARQTAALEKAEKEAQESEAAPLNF